MDQPATWCMSIRVCCTQWPSIRSGWRFGGATEQILEDVAGAATNPFDFSRNGTFVYHAGIAADQKWPIVWMDSSGKTEPLVTTPGNYSFPQFSPDGKRLALAVDTGKGQEIFVYDLQRDAMSRLTFAGDVNSVSRLVARRRALGVRVAQCDGGVTSELDPCGWLG